MKKSFKAPSAALNFISVPEEKPVYDDTHADVYTHEHTDVHDDVYTYKNMLVKETKTRRLQLLLKPSTYERLKTFADGRQSSVNDAVNTVLETFLENDNLRNKS